jgi:peptidoglycan hydrolase CwlO-like protein
LTFARNGKKDTVKAIEEEDKKFDGIKESLLKANMKLDQVCSTTTETRSDIKSLNKDIIMIDRRLTIVERDMKTAFNSIDELKGVPKHE